jgi:hypothetical protein
MTGSPFVNSDPRLILFFLTFLGVAGVPADRLACRLLIHESADVEGAQRFWQDVTGLGSEHFRRPTLKRHNPKTTRKNTGADYRGCLVIDVLRRVVPGGRRLGNGRDGGWRTRPGGASDAGQVHFLTGLQVGL